MKSWEDWKPPVRRLLEVFGGARHDCGAGEIGGDVDAVEDPHSSLCSMIDRESTSAVATIRNSLVVVEDKLPVEAVEDNFELPVEIEEPLAVSREAEDESELTVCLEKDRAVGSKDVAVVVAEGTVCNDQLSADWAMTAACRNSEHQFVNIDWFVVVAATEASELSVCLEKDTAVDEEAEEKGGVELPTLSEEVGAEDELGVGAVVTNVAELVVTDSGDEGGEPVV